MSVFRVVKIGKCVDNLYKHLFWTSRANIIIDGRSREIQETHMDNNTGMTLEEQKQKCRDILELGMDGLTSRCTNPSWFAWDRFTNDLIEALEDLERMGHC